MIPHGIPDGPHASPRDGKARLGLDPDRPLILTFGLLGPGKGIKTVLRAMPTVAAAHPDAEYLVLGATHPNLVREQGESYREELVALAAELGVGPNVRFEGRYVEFDELLAYLDAADLYVTPYPNRRPDHLGHALVRARARARRDLDAVLARRGVVGGRAR